MRRKEILLLLVVVASAAGLLMPADKEALNAFDADGGWKQSPCVGGATGHFYTEKVGNRWWLCSTFGHHLFFEGIGAWQPSNPGAKYGTNNAAALNAQNEALAWNFNAVGQKTYGSGRFPCPGCVEGACSGCKLLPMIQTFEMLSRATDNGDSYAPAGTVTKNLTWGVNASGAPWYFKPLLDVFDPNLVIYLTAYMRSNSDQNSFHSYKNNAHVVGVMIGDNDFFLGVGPGPDFDAGGNRYGGGKNESDLGRLVLTTSPIQTFNPSPAQGGPGDTPEIYSDTKVYAKTGMGSPPANCTLATPCSLRDYLHKKYDGSIDALNAAWASNYTTFDSSGTDRSQNICASTTWNGSNTTCSDTLTSPNISPHSVAVTVDGVLQAGDCPWFAGNTSSGGYSLRWCGGRAANSGYLGGRTGGTIARTSTIDYTTGAVTINFNIAPRAGAHTIKITYVQNGWMYGTGLMDEDGRNSSWIGTNVVCLLPVNGGGPGTDSWACRPGNPGSWPLPSASAKMAADIETWIGQYSAKFFSATTGTVHANTKALSMGTDSVGIWMQPANKNIYLGAAGNVDILFQELGWSPDDDPGSGVTTETAFNAAYEYVTRYYGDQPMINFYESNANPDSAMAGRGPSGVLTFASQAHRGQGYLNLVTDILNTQSFNGTHQWVGVSWWAWQDFGNEKTNWGLKTPTDNAYDGREDVTADVSCSPPLERYKCGGEKADYGDLIGEIRRANRLWIESAEETQTLQTRPKSP
jgi:hypothetical protein